MSIPIEFLSLLPVYLNVRRAPFILNRNTPLNRVELYSVTEISNQCWVFRRNTFYGCLRLPSSITSLVPVTSSTQPRHIDRFKSNLIRGHIFVMSLYIYYNYLFLFFDNSEFVGICHTIKTQRQQNSYRICLKCNL